jgi:RNA polymerase sigma-70 factor (ECF subfamily)
MDPHREHDELAAQAAGGDASAVSRLYDALSPGLYGYLADLTREPALAEDLLHQLWSRVLVSMDRRTGPVRPWLFCIARNLAIDAMRARRHRPQLPLPEASTPAAGPMQAIESREQAGQVRAAVEMLPADLREVVLLRFYSGMALREMGEVLDCPLGTVATRLRRALRTLEKELRCEQRA